MPYLGTNKGFELNSFAQFTTAENGSGAWTVVTTSPQAGTYNAQIASGNVALGDTWTASIKTDKLPCRPGANVSGGAYQKHYSAVDNGGVYSTRTVSVNFRFYDSGDNLLGSSLIDSWTASLSSESAWSLKSNTAVAPANTASVAIEVNYTIRQSPTGGGWNITERWDSFFLDIPGGSPQVIWWN